jgi:hypothetical protein
MKGIVKRLAITLVILFALTQIGCTALGTFAGAIAGPSDANAIEGVAVEATSTPLSTLVVLVDVSISTKGQREKYISALSRVLLTVGPGTTVEVLTITGDSRSRGQVLAEERTPAFTFTPKPDPSTDNPMLLAKARTAERERLNTELAEFEKGLDIEATRGRILDAATPTILSARTKSTDILGGLAEAANLIAASGQGRASVLILSDGVRDDQRANFARLRSPASARRIAGADEVAGRVAKLRGVRVLFVGANAGGPSWRYDPLQAYWSVYFKKAGAVMKPAWYGRPITDIVLSEWAGQTTVPETQAKGR